MNIDELMERDLTPQERAAIYEGHSLAVAIVSASDLMRICHGRPRDERMLLFAGVFNHLSSVACAEFGFEDAAGILRYVQTTVLPESQKEAERLMAQVRP